MQSLTAAGKGRPLPFLFARGRLRFRIAMDIPGGKVIASAPMDARPPQINQAVILLWAAYAVGPIRLGLNWNLLEAAMDDFLAASILAITLIGTAVLIWKISQGKNWARLTFLVLFLIGLPFSLYGLTTDFGRSLVDGILSAVQITLQGVGLLLISRGAAKDWFTKGYTEPSLPSISG